MAGIYAHIPFCKSRCIYCGFYSTTLLSLQDEYVDAMLRELDCRKDYLSGEPVKTIYIGGGTPSMLSDKNLSRLCKCLKEFAGENLEEFTVECNPDDVTPELASLLYSLGVNRVSMGAQTFSNERLAFIHRRHKAHQVEEAVNKLRNAGITNISIDLMFGFPDETLEECQNDINTALSLHVQHISAYCLMYEEGTRITQMLQAHEVEEISEENYMRMYNLLIDSLQENGFVQYEISNFSLPGFHSRHNSSYWDGTPYFGFGAAAHSYDIKTRSWNPSDIHIYIVGMEKGEMKPEVEQLDDRTRYNELVMTSLRTAKGLNLSELERIFGRERYDYCLQMAKNHLDSNTLEIKDNNIMKLTRKGIFTSDSIMSDMMI